MNDLSPNFHFKDHRQNNKQNKNKNPKNHKNKNHKTKQNKTKRTDTLTYFVGIIFQFHFHLNLADRKKRIPLTQIFRHAQGQRRQDRSIQIILLK